MASTVQDEQKAARLMGQRNLFALIALCALASIGLAVPRKLSNYRELKEVDARLIWLQAETVGTRQDIKDAEDKILGIQKAIREESRR
jgi:hypothetical protein